MLAYPRARAPGHTAPAYSRAPLVRSGTRPGVRSRAPARAPACSGTLWHAHALRARSGTLWHALAESRRSCAPACAHALRVRSGTLWHALDPRGAAREGSQSHPKSLTLGRGYARDHMGVGRAYGAPRCHSGEFRYADAQGVRGASDSRSRASDMRNRDNSDRLSDSRNRANRTSVKRSAREPQ